MARYHPLAEGTGTLSSGYGPRWGTHHNGQDYAAPLGTPIYAVADGTIIEGRDRAPGSVTGFGNWVWQDSQATCGKDFIYGHMRHADILVRKGDRVKAGQLIARVGNEGQSTGPHLHFEVWGAPGRIGGKHENPTNWLATAEWLKPTTTAKKEETMSDNAVDIDKHHLISFGRSTPLPKKIIIVHTTENAPGTSSQTILDYQVRTRTGSYHRLVDATGKITLANTDDWQTWSTGNKGNDIALHVSCVAQAKMTREQWLAQPKMLEGVARVIAHWSKKYGIPLVKLSRQELGAGKHGVAGHLEAQVWGNTTHWDPGYHFPYDVVLKRAKEINEGKSAPAVSIPPTPAPKAPMTLDTPCKSHVAGSKHVAPLADYIMYIDRGVYEGRHQIDQVLAATERIEKQNAEILALLKEGKK
ncbi:peptidoglycan DD-metalloendopeptidase family protein [Corynebacterium amycolatum]|uniref:peptidoglycan DD-metalloendopeptidase family protein n=1 Tax=Corynebacterium amycolatum TaxID=43765 RepID=UPI003AF48CD5